VETFTFVLVALSCYRITRLVTRDRITLRLRRAIDGRLGDTSTWGYFVRCPWCVGAWVAAGVVFAVDADVGLRLPLLYWLAVSAVIGLLGVLDP